MRTVFLLLSVTLSILVNQAIAEDRQALQQQLNQACEAARLEKLKPLREKYAAECVAQ